MLTAMWAQLTFQFRRFESCRRPYITFTTMILSEYTNTIIQQVAKGITDARVALRNMNVVIPSFETLLEFEIPLSCGDKYYFLNGENSTCTSDDQEKIKFNVRLQFPISESDGE